MNTIRNITLQSIQRIPENVADIVPAGFNNNIRWNFGHIAFIQERLVIDALGEEMKVPKEFETFFNAGTKPADWTPQPPTFEEIASVLADQSRRIKELLAGRLEDKLPTPFTNRAGITFYTAGETLLFSFFHEGMHLETIKRIYWEIKNGK